MQFTAVPFDHPIWILYSSGTTGKPKAITHSCGGILLEHFKALALHQNVQEGERFIWYATTGWMMWNYALSSLLVGATLCIYEGSLVYPEKLSFWNFIAEHQIDHVGAGAAYYIANQQFELTQPRYQPKTIGSTGSPLPPQTFSWLQKQFPQAQIISLSGGTDVCSAFLSGNPLLPVYAGEIQCLTLGSKIEAYNENGESVKMRWANWLLHCLCLPCRYTFGMIITICNIKLVILINIQVFGVMEIGSSLPSMMVLSFTVVRMLL